MSDFELLPVDAIDETIEEFRDPENEVNLEYFFVPFAMNNAGDQYCFWYHTPFEASEPPVALVSHDSDELLVLAKNLQDFIFRKFCETLSDIWDKDIVKELKEGLDKALLCTHLPYLTTHQGEVLKDLFSREVQTFKTKWGDVLGVLSDKELEALLQREIGFEELDKAYDYSV